MKYVRPGCQMEPVDAVAVPQRWAHPVTTIRGESEEAQTQRFLTTHTGSLPLGNGKVVVLKALKRGDCKNPE